MISAIMWAVVVVALISVFYALARFSEELGEALRIRPYYISYYAASLLLFIGIQMRLLGTVAPDLAFKYVRWHEALVAIGVTIALITTIIYWGWLLSAHRKMK
jgi:predicted tellurium resistance membrane protein TerC